MPYSALFPMFWVSGDAVFVRVNVDQGKRSWKGGRDRRDAYKGPTPSPPLEY